MCQESVVVDASATLGDTKTRRGAGASSVGDSTSSKDRAAVLDEPIAPARRRQGDTVLIRPNSTELSTMG